MTETRTARRTVTRANPCPVCGGDHKCSVERDATGPGLIMCGRTTGPVPGFVYLKQCKSDEQFALYRQEGDPVLVEREREREREQDRRHEQRHGSVFNGRAHGTNGKPIDWNLKAHTLARNLTAERRDELAAALGLPVACLDALPLLGYDSSNKAQATSGEWVPDPCWTFPETDGEGKVIGISRRTVNGNKRAMPYANRGLTVPNGWREHTGPLYLPEGASDVLALSALGLAAVGRPSNTGGVLSLTVLLADVPVSRPIVVLGELDAKPDGSWPGRDGAQKTAEELAAKLSRAVFWAMPPNGAKDVRQWVVSRGLDLTCLDSWHDAGEAFARAVDDQCQEIKPSVAEQQSTAVMEEVDAADLLLEDDPPLCYLPLLGRDGYVFQGWSNLLASYPRCGKTELLAACCRQWAERGEKVLYLTEESRSIWRKRIARIGGNWRGVRLVFALGRTTAELLERIKNGDETAVVVDTLRNLGFLPEDESDNGKVARIVNPLIGCCRNQNKTLVGSHHMRKGGGENGEGIAGGHALMGAFDAILELRRDSAKNRRVIKAYARLEQPEDLLYERGPSGNLYALGEVHAYERAEIQRRALKVLGEEWTRTTEILEAMDEPAPTAVALGRALKDAARDGKIERDPPVEQVSVQGKTVRWRKR